MISKRVSDLLPDDSGVDVVSCEYSDEYLKERYEALKEFLQTMCQSTVSQWPSPITPWTSRTAVNFGWQLHGLDKLP